MIEPETVARPPAEVLRAKIAGMVRADLAEEAAAGFSLVGRFPNSETASVPGHFEGFSASDKEILLDALAHYSTVQWSHEVVREKSAHPVLRRFLARRPIYPPGDWYGARPKKSALKKAMSEALTKAGYARIKEPNLPADLLRFSHPDPAFAGRLFISFDPGFPRQMDFGLNDWLRADLARHFELPDARAFIPIIRQLAYDHLWDGHGVNNPICWDVVVEKDLEETGRLLVEVLQRLATLAARINGLAA
jgi:hypothetical protein